MGLADKLGNLDYVRVKWSRRKTSSTTPAAITWPSVWSSALARPWARSCQSCDLYSCTAIALSALDTGC